MVAGLFLLALGAYLACGLIFAVPFALVGAKRIDPHAQHGSWGFRVLIIPGVMALWPLLLRRWLSGVHRFAVPALKRRAIFKMSFQEVFQRAVSALSSTTKVR